MRRWISFLCVCLVVMLSVPTAAAEAAAVERLPDGYYVIGQPEVTELTTDDVCDRTTITSKKVLTYYGPSDDEQWTMELTGVFTYNGTTSTCTDASVSYTIHNSTWHFKSKSASPSGNTANGSLTMELRFMGLVLTTVTRTLTITCDANGHLS